MSILYLLISCRFIVVFLHFTERKNFIQVPSCDGLLTFWIDWVIDQILVVVSMMIEKAEGKGIVSPCPLSLHSDSDLENGRILSINKQDYVL